MGTMSLTEFQCIARNRLIVRGSINEPSLGVDLSAATIANGRLVRVEYLWSPATFHAFGAEVHCDAVEDGWEELWIRWRTKEWYLSFSDEVCVTIIRGGNRMPEEASPTDWRFLQMLPLACKQLYDEWMRMGGSSSVPFSVSPERGAIEITLKRLYAFLERQNRAVAAHLSALSATIYTIHR